MVSNVNCHQQFRRFYWLETDAETLEFRLQELINTLPIVSETLIISNRRILNLPTISARDAIQYLGRDTERVIFDALAGFNPNAFAQVCGTLRGGGELILVSPDRSEWAQFEDPEYVSMRGSRFTHFTFPGHFIRHLIFHLERFSPSASLPIKRPVSYPYLSDEQKTLVQHLVESLSSSRSTRILTADRGRGKTASLGLALAKWANLSVGRPMNAVITASNRQSIDGFFAILCAQLPEGKSSGNHFTHARINVRFYPPSVLLRKCDSPDLIIVDEAASLAVSLLQQLQRVDAHHWYATTLHGYEGNGRGFELRFIRWLNAESIPYELFTLRQPVRWAESDPLEALSYRLLQLDAEPVKLKPSDSPEVKYQPLSQSDLIGQEALLHSVFGLLIAAHYRTTPNDLRQLFDSPDLLIRVLTLNNSVMAVALLVEEGPLLASLIEPIWQGYRRPPGDLIPQTLVSREGIQQAGSLRGWRVMRLAVHPDGQNVGYGSLLLEHIKAEATELRLDFCGASFAADIRLFNFWRANGFVPLRLGERSDRVTAGWPLLVFYSFSQHARAIQADVERVFHQRLLLKLMHSTQDVDMLLHCVAGLTVDLNITDQDVAVVKGVAFHQRGIEDSYIILRHWLSHPVNIQKLLRLPEVDRKLLVAWILQMRGDEVSIQEGSQTDRRTHLKSIKSLFAELLSG